MRTSRNRVSGIGTLSWDFTGLALADHDGPALAFIVNLYAHLTPPSCSFELDTNGMLVKCDGISDVSDKEYMAFTKSALRLPVMLDFLLEKLALHFKAASVSCRPFGHELRITALGCQCATSDITYPEAYLRTFIRNFNVKASVERRHLSRKLGIELSALLCDWGCILESLEACKSLGLQSETEHYLHKREDFLIHRLVPMAGTLGIPNNRGTSEAAGNHLFQATYNLLVSWEK